jgi:hypothetical protein
MWRMGGAWPSRKRHTERFERAAHGFRTGQGTGHLHLWRDKSLGSQLLADRMSNPRQYLKRLEHWWQRVSEWPR